jgi:hypothetical protein
MRGEIATAAVTLFGFSPAPVPQHKIPITKFPNHPHQKHHIKKAPGGVEFTLKADANAQESSAVTQEARSIYENKDWGGARRRISHHGGLLVVSRYVKAPMRGSKKPGAYSFTFSAVPSAKDRNQPGRIEALSASAGLASAYNTLDLVTEINQQRINGGNQSIDDTTGKLDSPDQRSGSITSALKSGREQMTAKRIKAVSTQVGCLVTYAQHPQEFPVTQQSFLLGHKLPSQVCTPSVNP